MANQNKAKRKALERSFKRQKGRCHLCGDQMSMSLDDNDDKRATADHVTPKSMGGAIQGNIKAAHALCNRTRGNMAIEDFIRWQSGEFDPRKYGC